MQASFPATEIPELEWRRFWSYIVIIIITIPIATIAITTIGGRLVGGRDLRDSLCR